MKKILSLCLLATMFSIAAFADIRLPDTPAPTPAPKQKKALEATLSIQLDKNASEARLIIPKSQLRQLRAELENLDDDSENAAAVGVTKTQTIVSGLFLSLAFVFGGVWFARSRKSSGKINKTIAAGAVLFLVGTAATFVFGNAGPPTALRTISGRLFNKQTFAGWNSAYGRVKVETSGEKDVIELIVPASEEIKSEE